MKAHKLFACATMICFCLTMITGHNMVKGPKAGAAEAAESEED